MKLNRSVYWLLGLPFDAVTRAEAIALIAKAIRAREPLFMSTPNLNFLIASRRNPMFRESVLASDLSVADGMPIVWIARLLGVPIPERVAGSDLFEAMLGGEAGPVKVFLFGGEAGVAARAEQRINELGGAVRCVGHHSPGFVSVEEMSSPEVIDEINASGADFVLVALGAAKGQAWIMRNREKLSAPVISHLGAVINFTAGTVRRAPRWMQKCMLEWLWRIIEEPKLLGRYVRDGMALLRLGFGTILPLMCLRLLPPRGAEASVALVTLGGGDGASVIDMRGRWNAGAGRALLNKLHGMDVPATPVQIRMHALSGKDPALLGFIYQLTRRFPSVPGSGGVRVVDSERAASWYRLNHAEDLVDSETPRGESQTVSERRGFRHLGLIVFLTVLLLVTVELLLQVRAHVRFGQSVFNLLVDETRYVEDEAAGIKLLRPNRLMQGSSITIETNSRGLRSPEIPQERAFGSFRMAVVGASSVMGEMAESNEATFPYLLERNLQERFDGRAIDVINAGVSGHRLADQRGMIAHVVGPYRPDLVVLYSGANDIADYCSETDEKAAPRGLPLLSMPGWVLTTAAIKRHTGFLRPPANAGAHRQPDDIDLTAYRRDLESIALLAQRQRVALAFVTNGKAYGREQSDAEQRQFGAEAMRFAPCFDLAGMFDLYDMHNDAIRDVSARHGLPVLDLAEILPPGGRYFIDATHFTLEGERRVAELLGEFLVANDLVEFRD